MREVTAGRTIVKSPPELWAVCSDAASLAQHLEAFGEIRITRLEPETTVAWEGERASGTVRIEPSGWGTKVTVTAAAAEPEVAPEPTVTAPASEEAPPVAPEPDAHAPIAPEPDAHASVAPDPDAHALQPERMLSESERNLRRGFFARLFGGGRRPRSQPVVAEAAICEPAEVVGGTEPAVCASPAPSADPQGPVDAAAALEAALDSLGQAHRRPFSR